MVRMQSDDALAQLVISVAETHDLQPRYGYSGRNMYGRTCFGLIGDLARINGFIIDVVTDLLEDDDNEVNMEFVGTLRNMATDSMGHESIMYFPDLDIQDNEDNDE